MRGQISGVAHMRSLSTCEVKAEEFATQGEPGPHSETVCGKREKKASRHLQRVEPDKQLEVGVEARQGPQLEWTGENTWEPMAEGPGFWSEGANRACSETAFGMS